MEMSTSLYLNDATRIYQCHSYTDRFTIPFSLFCISHLLTLPSHYQHLGLSVSPLKCLAFDDVSGAEGQPIIHQRPCPCLDDPNQFKLEYLRACAPCSYPFYIIPELASLLLLIEIRVADATNSSRQFHPVLLGTSPICEWPFYLYHLIMMLLHGFTA
jgi:hypothetical protein